MTPVPILAAVLVIALAATGASAQSPAKPKVPPGTDPGGTAIALIAHGVDYTDPEIAPRLARDGEGDIIGWDFIAGDNKPYAAGAENGVDGTGSPSSFSRPMRVDDWCPSALRLQTPRSSPRLCVW